MYQSSLLIFLILISGAFSGAEIALTTLSKAKVKAISKDKKFASSAIVKLKKKPQRLLITILIGNNLVNILATVVATSWALELFKDQAIGIVTGFLTFIILVFGEITPKTIAQKYAVSFSRAVAFPLLWLSRIILPVIYIFELLVNLLSKMLNLKGGLQSISEDELLAMVDLGTKEGVIQEQEQELIENVLEFTETTAEEVMTTKKHMQAINCKTSLNEAVRFFLDHSHSRIPVFKENLNNIIGIVTVHDILRLLSGNSNQTNLLEIKFKQPIVVPKTKSISQLFHEFQRRRQHMAIVVDEHGDTVGLVTVEDILEEIVGDILDEKDKEEKLIQSIGKNEWDASGKTTIEQIKDVTGSEIDFPEHEAISLLILKELNRFPKNGEKINFGELTIQVKEMSKKKIEKVTINKISKPDNEEEL